jgi:hypothetical protein
MPSALVSPCESCISYWFRLLRRVTKALSLLPAICLYTRRTVVRSCKLRGSTTSFSKHLHPIDSIYFPRLLSTSPTALQYLHSAIYLTTHIACTTGRFAQPGVDSLLSKHEGSCRSIAEFTSCILPQLLQHHMRGAHHLERLVIAEL